MTHVSVVIPNYNGVELLKKHLPAVLTMIQDKDELIIVDDASTDESWQWLHTFFRLGDKDAGFFEVSRAKIIAVVVSKNEANMRFAITANRGVELAQYPIVFLLNSDVEPSAHIFSVVLPHFDDPQVFAVGCLEKEEQQGKVSYSGKKILWFEHGMFMHAKAADLTPGEMDWVSGGSGFFDRKKWLELGGFDPDFAPAYWEDVDISLRARKKGWTILFEPEAVVDHQHETTNASVFGAQRILKVSIRNGKRFTWKNGSWWQKILFIIWQPYWLIKWSRWQALNTK